MNSLATPPAGRLPESHRSRTMFAPARSLITLGTNILTANTMRKLGRDNKDVPAQEKQLANYLQAVANTQYGREFGIEARMAYEKFREKVPLRTYESFIPYIEKMTAGEPDVLWPGYCSFFAVSSGTTAGRTKYLPITEGMLEHFRRTGLDSLLYYTARVGHTGVFRGKHLFLGGCTTLSPLKRDKGPEGFAGDLSGITALNLPSWVERYLYEPGTDIAQMADWPSKISAIAKRTLRRDMTMLAGIPSWVLILSEALLSEAGFANIKARQLRDIWPNLECLIHGGVPIAPFADELRQVLGSNVNFHEVYPASEGFIAAQDAEAAMGLRLMTGHGIFYEFLPLSEYDESRLGFLGTRTVPLSGVKPGVDYVLIMTTPAGLSRYIIGDVVRFTSTKPARLVYAGRTKLQLSAFGEHVIEKELTDALFNVCSRRGWNLVNFHVAPVFTDSQLGRKRGYHEWWVELKPGSVTNPTGPLMAGELDAELQRLNDDYEAKRKGGGLEMPVVRLVMPGVFEKWMRSAGKWGGQNKMPRCRSDREIADQIAGFSRFHH